MRNKITDAGELLPYAAKHRQREDIKSDSEITLKSIWPEPEWSSLIKDGLPPSVASRLYMFYSNLRKKPRKGGAYWTEISSRQWEDGFVDSIERIKQIFNKINSDDGFKNINNLLAQSYGFDDAQDSELYADMSQSFPYWSVGRGERKLKPPKSVTGKDFYLSKCIHLLGWPESKKPLKFGRFPVELDTGKFCMGWGEGTKILLDRERYDSFGEVIERIKNELQNFQNKEKEKIPVKPSVKGIERIGKAHRDSSVSSEDLMQVFGIRAIQFGESMSNKEKQEWLDSVFDALCDLADILKIPRKWIGLGGIGLAFGARGKGGALAHYEQDLRVINLTRAKGAGSLAHEWFHAFDNRFCNTVYGPGYSYLSTQTRHIRKSDKFEDKFISIINEFKNIQKIIGSYFEPSEFYERSRKVEGIKGSKDYWTKSYELFARSFESYIQDAISKQGHQSPWLSYGTVKEDYLNTASRNFPYPLDKERELLFEGFDNLFNEVRCLK